MSELCGLGDSATINALIDQLRKSDERLPLAVSVDLTYRCDFRCPHCFCRLPQDAPPDPPELSFDQWDRILGQCADEGALFLTFTGGEPLVRQDFRDLWVMAKRRGFMVELFTNGSLLTADLADFLAEWTPKQVSVTVYAATEETYQRMTGRQGMHSRTLRALDLLVERDLPVEVKGLFTRLNVDQFDAVRKQALRYDDIFRWQAELAGCYAHGGGDPASVSLSPAEIVALELADTARSNEWRRRLVSWRPAPPNTDSPFRCQIGIGRCHVDPYGRMRPCLLLEGTSYNLATGSVKEGWREVLPRLLANFPWQRGPCQVCDLADICRICVAYALLARCTATGPSPFHCALGEKRAEVYGLNARAAARGAC